VLLDDVSLSIGEETEFANTGAAAVAGAAAVVAAVQSASHTPRGLLDGHPVRCLT
jgi:hypothetical protein